MRLFLSYAFFVALWLGFTVSTNAQPTMPQCPDLSQSVCRVVKTWTVEELEALLHGEASGAFVDGDQLTFVYTTDDSTVTSVQVCCGIQEPLLRVGDSYFWVRSLRVDRLNEAVISYGFAPMTKNNTGIGRLDGHTVYRGADAPPEPAFSQDLQGRIYNTELESAALGTTRGLTIYLPPDHDPEQRYPVIYHADGQSVESYAHVLEPLILDGSVPPLILVGAHSSEQRAQEYLPGQDEKTFNAHEQFFTEELPRWAEAELGASDQRQDRAVFGFSNGGVFAAAMGIKHPEIYGAALPFSMDREVLLEEPLAEADVRPRFYLGAGTLEHSFFRATYQQAQWLDDAGYEVVFKERVGGHDFVWWNEEYPNAVIWVFGNQQP